MTVTKLGLLRLFISPPTSQWLFKTPEKPDHGGKPPKAQPILLFFFSLVAANPFETFPRSSLGGRWAILWLGPLILTTLNDSSLCICYWTNRTWWGCLYMCMRLQVNGLFLPYQPLNATLTTSLAGIIVLDWDHLILSKAASFPWWKQVALGKK